MFGYNIDYKLDEINKVANKHGFFVTDCLKDDNQITVSDKEDDYPLFIFKRSPVSDALVLIDSNYKVLRNKYNLHLIME